VAAEAPELYHAYIGVAQISDQFRSEFLAYEYMLKKFKENGNKRMVQRLEKAPITLTGGIPDAYRRLRDPAMHLLGVGTTHDMRSVISGIFLPSLTCREYTMKEKINMWRGKSSSGISVVWNDMIGTDLSEKVRALKIPVYFIEGIYDYTCSYTEAGKYFNKLTAPVKGFYTFSNSAHSPHFEEPGKMLNILLNDVLSGSNTLSDKN
jgi:pimeloyl-ACP methyl ester carboxylesterase